ncbi:MAG TPA: 3,4-dihydroxy-2-butanone-4-phosphate synthase [Guyparkeria sp.]|nr:3,4-dihydroxy-2-butanone-4-phosphate synthase [Guyparkeria sp.]
MSFSPIDEILDDLRAGRMAIIVDDEDRENEGDLVMLAEHARAEDINFMARYGRGLICLTLTQERCERLELPLMVSRSREPFQTAFTVSIEAARGVTTGISAADRACTIRTAVSADAGPADLVQPGHVFPLMARPGGVLARAGHTEAGVDLARLAQAREPAAVIVEILNEDGSMARRPDLERFAAEHDIKIGSIEDLIRYRMRHERSVEHQFATEIDTRHGRFTLHAYKDFTSGQLQFAAVRGKLEAEVATPVRVHVHHALCDLFEPQGRDCGWPFSDVLSRLAKMESGVVVLLRSTPNEDELLRQLQGWEQTAAETVNGEVEELRSYGVGAQILKDLGVRKMRVMSAPKRFHALAGFGLEVVDYIYDEAK